MLSGALLKGGVRKSLPVLPVSRLISCLARASQGQVIVVVGCASKCLAACLCEHGTPRSQAPSKENALLPGSYFSCAEDDAFGRTAQGRRAQVLARPSRVTPNQLFGKSNSCL